MDLFFESLLAPMFCAEDEANTLSSMTLHALDCVHDSCVHETVVTKMFLWKGSTNQILAFKRTLRTHSEYCMRGVGLAWVGHVRKLFSPDKCF